MARKVERFIVPAAGGRDAGKVFIITEKPAFQAETWANRLLCAMGNARIDIPEGLAGMGMAGIVAIGVQALSGMSFPAVKPLLDEMLECIQFMPDPNKPAILRALNMHADDIEEVATIYRLRRAVFDLHVGFLISVLSQTLGAPGAEKSSEGSPNTSTRPAP